MNDTATAPPPLATDSSLAGARTWFTDNGHTRTRDGRLLGGVMSGIARRYGWNPLVTRVLGALGLLTVTPLPYIALWILMPRDP